YLIAFSVAQPLVTYLLSMGQETYSQSLIDNVAMLFGMCFFIVMNFFGQKLFVFRKVKGKTGHQSLAAGRDESERADK
ncbi:MAG: hypothetical protein K2N77_11325, partial [Lachnospiraceae bacterium]|nr:hypothetical protein [Lachnospiraceae bacterium]